jgi:hypothetical protein
MSLDATSVSPADLLAFDAAFDQLDRDSQADRWAADSVAWVQERAGEFVWSLQGDIMRSVRDNARTAVPACHGPGKSHLASRAVGHFVATKPLGDFAVVTTAPTAHQVRAILWRYIRRLHKKAGLPGRITQGMVPEWKIDGELVAFGRKPADYDEDAFQGMHDLELLIVFDEACGVPEQLWVAAESLMTNDETCRFLAIGNPTSSSSFFHKACTTEPGWNVIPISAYDTPNLTGEPVPEDVARRLVSKAWVEDKVRRWGPNSPLFKAKVLGQFADDDDGLIPLAWVTEANYRWHDWNDTRQPGHQPTGRTVLGVDVGHSGEDRTVIATRKGHVVFELESWQLTDTVQTTALVEARLGQHVQAVAVVDGVGVGAGVVDLLRHHRRNVRSFIAGAGGRSYHDATGMLTFADLRSAAWWYARETLDPARNPTLALPEDDELTADLTAPRWFELKGGVVKVESKDEIKKRLGRSTDYGDAVVQALWEDRIPRGMDEQGSRLPALRPSRYAHGSGGWH